MSDENTLRIPISTLEDLHCSICEGYLSCSPIRLLPDGKCICGRCIYTDGSVQRVLPFEAILSKMSFPCNFKKYGCSELVSFGQAVNHESNCLFCPFACPTPMSCSWKGSSSQMHGHFVKKHPRLIQTSAKFMFKLDCDTRGLFMVKKQAAVFIIKYRYSSNKNELMYDVRYFMNEIKYDASCKIQLINADADCSLNLKITKCLHYDNSFYNMQSALILNLNKFSESLDNPTAITVVMNLTVSAHNATDQVAVDYDLLELLRCKKCKYYLIPPIFDSTYYGTICYNCCSGQDRGAAPSRDKNLLKLLEDTYYPCRWHDCSFVAKSTNIQQHELTCHFRRYCCVVPDCNVMFTLTSAADHLHCADHLFNRMFKISFSELYDSKYVYIIKANTLIALKYYSSPGYQEVLLYLLSDLVKITVVIHFEHEHCTLKSEPFILVSDESKSIKLRELPFCFQRNDNVSVVIDQWDTA